MTFAELHHQHTPLVIANVWDATFGRLKQAGVSRISMGNFMHSAIQLQLKNLLERIQAQQSFAEVFIDESAR